MPLLDFYKSRFGSAIKPQGNGWNGPCPLCGGEPGKSDRFVVWPGRDESLGETCARNHVLGIWSCRRCGRSGDTIAYLMQIDGLDFKAALGELGIENGRTGYRRRPAPREPLHPGVCFAPKVWPEPSDTWRAYAEKLLAEATDRIASESQALRWLAARGIAEEAVKRYRIGYLPAEGSKYPGRWRCRSALGLAPKPVDGGKVREKIFIPRGIVIPTFAHAGGKLLNLRIRRHERDLTPLPDGRKPSKYMELEGACKAPLLLRPTGPAHLAAWFVTEAELDAMLIHFATGGVVGGVAVRTNNGRPDAQAHSLLSSSARVCVALDYDAAVDEHGQEYVPADAPGSQGLDFWERTYPQYLRWPTPEGKDPGDAYRLGVDIREWVAEALPPSIVLPDFSGHLDTCAAGLPDVGSGAEPGSPPLEGSGPAGLAPQMRTMGDDGRKDDGEAAPMPYAEAFSSEEIGRIEGALPAYLSLAEVPLDVCRAWLLWQGVPASFTKTRDADGNSVGFSWDYDHAWKRTHEAAFEAFWRFQNASQDLWNWMNEHVDMKITFRNLLRIWG